MTEVNMHKVLCYSHLTNGILQHSYIKTKYNKIKDQDSVAGSVIQASGMVLFEDGLKPGTLVVDIWSAASVRTTPVVNLAPHVRSHPDLGVQCGVEVA